MPRGARCARAFQWGKYQSHGPHPNRIPNGQVQHPPSSTNLWVGNLPLAYTEEDVIRLFNPYGRIRSCVSLPPKPGCEWAAAMVGLDPNPNQDWVLGPS